MNDSIIDRLADYASRLRYADLPDVVIHESKRRIIDTLGCGIAAYDAEPSRIARAAALRARSAGRTPVLGTAARTLPELAAFANGAMTRYLDGNDCYPGGGGHPSDSLVPLLAVADAAGTDGTAALTAIVLGYEIHHALFHGIRLIEKGLDHVFYVAVACAAGTAKLRGLDDAQIANAIALAVVSCLPLEVVRHGELSMWKGASAGEAARAGVFAATLAEAGMTGPVQAFEGPHGLKELIGDFELPPLTEPGGRFRILEADMKCLTAEYHAQGPILAALGLRRDLAIADIEAVTIFTYAHAAKNIGSGAEKWRPTTRETADHSLPYMVAAALTDGQFSDDIFASTRLTDPRILALVDKITVQEDPALTKRFPRSFPCRIEIALRGGVRRASALANPPGHHDRPMTDDEVSAKFRGLAGRKLPADRLEQALDLVWGLDRGGPLSALFAALRVEEDA